MKISFKYRFANLSKEGYRHFPIFWFAYGKDGFGICVLGIDVCMKFGKEQCTSK